MKVLIAIEDKFDAVAIVECVHNRNWPRDTELVLVHVVDVGERFGQAKLAPKDADLKIERAHSYQLLRKAAEEIRSFMPEASIEIGVCYGEPEEQILLALKDKHPDVVVIGKHPRNKLLRLLHPDVGQHILEVAAKEADAVHVVDVPVIKLLAH